MAYSIANAYKDVEQILKRPLNSFEFMKIDSWFSRYSINYLEFSFSKLLKMPNIYSTNFIDTYLFRNYEYFKELVEFIPISNQLTTKNDVEQKEEKPKVETKETNYNDWDEYPELEREYWVAKLGYTFYPNEYPNPDLDSKYDGINKN